MVERLKRIPLWGSYALLAYMPFHIFLSQWLSTFTGGLEAWKVGKDIVTAALLAISLTLFFWHRLYKEKAFQWLLIGAFLYAAIHILFLLFDDEYDLWTTLVATLFNNRLFAYLFIGIVGAWLNKKIFNKRLLIKIVLTVGAATAIFGIAQYLLPSDLMTHFGYSVERGARPAFFIDDKPDLPRIMSTTRDPNSYGAYLILPILLALRLFSKKPTVNLDRKYLVFALLAMTTALVLTFSRSAWLSFLASLCAFALLAFKDKLRIIRTRKAMVAMAVLLFAGTLAFYFSADNYFTKNVILHSDEQTFMEDPNELRLRFQQEAAEDIINNPAGHGPGTAGIVAISNPNGGILTENYFLQIGYEVGLAGLALFLALYAYLYKLLSNMKNDRILVAVLVATMIGYIISSLLNHLWSNEAVAAQWWLLTGLALGAGLKARES